MTNNSYVERLLEYDNLAMVVSTHYTIPAGDRITLAANNPLRTVLIFDSPSPSDKIQFIPVSRLSSQGIFIASSPLTPFYKEFDIGKHGALVTTQWDIQNSIAGAIDITVVEILYGGV